MKRSSVSVPILLTLFFLLLAGCGKDDDSTELIGYVIKENAASILVIGDASSNMQNSQAPEAMSLGVTNAKWKGITAGKLQVGHKVRVTIHGPIALSYPAQANAAKIELLEQAPKKPGILSEQEAVEKALSQHADRNSLYVNRAELLPSEKVWRIELDDYLRPGNPTEVRIDAASAP
ncbi:DUF3221 domain-containing protein [Paenibacillus sp. MBLB4367]|uniref:DUF3221 domain-containing protein n=1 Tax=Paenibacillus sp. MBLB4367 TaxID=3384767 RepID=UPI0039081166